MRISEIEDWRVSQRKGVLRQAISDLKYHNIGQFLHTISSFDLTVDNTPGLEEVLNENKQLIIKNILTRLKNYENSYEQLMLIIGFLAKLTLTKINWPELEVINQSVKAQIDNVLKVITSS